MEHSPVAKQLVEAVISDFPDHALGSVEDI
jgi:hypothetical protein